LHDPDLESLYSGLAAPQEDDDRLFDRGWAVAVLHSAMNQLGAEYEQQGRASLFNAIKSCLSIGGRTFEYHSVGQQLDMREDALRMAVNRMRRRFGELLRQQVKQTLPDPNEAEEELKYLLSCL
jgi:RNA polymerase sigma-70 factor (ECF subfamily)